jgi:diguanylate cyclase (GGDEF) domain
MFDLDHFKRINDTYGHDGGDAVLVAVAGCAGAVEGATLGRLGGEEFALLLPGVDLAEAVVRMNALRRTLRALDVVVRERPVPVSASFGVAEFCNGASVDDVLKNADVALYHAKSSGRDRVSVCGVLAAAE